MDPSTLISRLDAATSSFHNLERQLADPDVAADPEAAADDRQVSVHALEPLVLDYAAFRRPWIHGRQTS